jgi:hypothetical protein
VVFLQENLINLSAIHSEHYTKIDELFAVLPEDKIDEQTAKEIDFDDDLVAPVGHRMTTYRSEFKCLRYRCLDLMVTLVNGFTSATYIETVQPQTDVTRFGFRAPTLDLCCN